MNLMIKNVEFQFLYATSDARAEAIKKIHHFVQHKQLPGSLTLENRSKNLRVLTITIEQITVLDLQEFLTMLQQEFFMSNIELSAEETAKLFAGLHAIKNEFQIEELLRKFFKKFYDKGFADGLCHQPIATTTKTTCNSAIQNIAELKDKAFWLVELNTYEKYIRVDPGFITNEALLRLFIERALAFRSSELAIARAEELLGNTK